MNDGADIAALIRRTNELLTVLVKTQLSNILEIELADEKKRKLYEHTGSLGQVALTSKIGMSAGAISGHWKRWEQVGLLVKDGKSYRRVFP
ncbi:MAG: hypothetical protein RLN85_18905 [Pseudomonadales bacterium]